MKIVTNNKIIKRNSRIGSYSMIISLVILAGGFIISLGTDPNAFPIALLALVVGFTLSQVGIYFGNRFGRDISPDKAVSDALKGLDNNYTLYNFTSPVGHLLIGPAGIWAILPYFQKGKIIFDKDKGRWKQKGGNWYLKIFGQEGLGRCDLDVAADIKEIKKFLKKEVQLEQDLDVQAALLFYNDKVEVEALEAPYPTVKGDKLKDVIRRNQKAVALDPAIVQAIAAKLPSESID